MDYRFTIISNVSVIWLFCVNLLRSLICISLSCVDIEELKPYVNCPENFANLTEEIENGVWVCVGSCKKNVNFCNQNGKCLNEITGPQCK